jgi:hypothetical protein
MLKHLNQDTHFQRLPFDHRKARRAQQTAPTEVDHCGLLYSIKPWHTDYIVQTARLRRLPKKYAMVPV